jgi:hypothetical protein
MSFREISYVTELGRFTLVEVKSYVGFDVLTGGDNEELEEYGI